MATILDNVNFKLLLQQHGGDYSRAKAAWDKILQLGGYGNVPHNYEGGLDVKGLRVMLEERQQGQAQAVAFNPHYVAARNGEAVAEHTPIPRGPENLEDVIHKIEDIAAGDNPQTVR